MSMSSTNWLKVLCLYCPLLCSTCDKYLANTWVTCLGSTHSSLDRNAQWSCHSTLGCWKFPSRLFCCFNRRDLSYKIGYKCDFFVSWALLVPGYQSVSLRLLEFHQGFFPISDFVAIPGVDCLTQICYVCFMKAVIHAVYRPIDLNQGMFQVQWGLPSVPWDDAYIYPPINGLCFGLLGDLMKPSWRSIIF